MKLSHFQFNLPKELLAEFPAENRDESRLMVIDRKKQTIEHKMFKDVIDYFDDGDVMVMNNTKVFPARLYGNKEKTGAKIEVFLLRELNNESKLWDVLVDPARKIRVGNKLYFGDSDLVAEVIDNTTSRGRTIRFLYDGDHDALMQAIHELHTHIFALYPLDLCEFHPQIPTEQAITVKEHHEQSSEWSRLFSSHIIQHFSIFARITCCNSE